MDRDRIIVLLNENERKYCLSIAEQRNNENRSKNVFNNKFCDKSDIEVDYIGACGEYAFCKHFNLHFDDEIKARSGSYDCIMKGKRIDVKTKFEEKEWLWMPPKRNPDIDIFAYCIFHVTFIKIIGYQFADFVYHPKNLSENKYGKGYKIKTADLHKFIIHDPKN